MPDSKTKILFIHHSTGANLIKQGHLREILRQKDPEIELWDHSYNLYPVSPMFLAKHSFHTGLSNDLGKVTGEDYKIKLSNNSPKEYAEILSSDPAESPLQEILQYDIIAFKNCYPTTKISSQTKLETFQEFYSTIRDSIKKYPRKKFILITPPPLRKNATNEENAKRAIELVNWLTSDEYKKDVPNLFVFNLFGLLIDQKGFLKPDYCRFLPTDSHPNQKANQAIAMIFADFIIRIKNSD